MMNAQERHEYFDKHVDMAVEVEYESGGRHWYHMKGAEVKKFLDNLDEDEYFSDCDFVVRQSDAWVRSVLNHAEVNFFQNHAWCKRHGIDGSLNKVLNFIIDENLVPFFS